MGLDLGIAVCIRMQSESLRVMKITRLVKTYIEDCYLMSNVLVGSRGQKVSVNLLTQCSHIVEAGQSGKVFCNNVQ